MYYVYHGFVNSDNYDASEGPIFKLSRFVTEKQVIEFRKEFNERVNCECAHVVFRVFEGKERELIPKETVMEWRLKP